MGAIFTYVSDLLFPVISFICALVFGAMAYIAKYRWVDRDKTTTFASLAILATMSFLYWVMFMSGIE